MVICNILCLAAFFFFCSSALWLGCVGVGHAVGDSVCRVSKYLMFFLFTFRFSRNALLAREAKRGEERGW